MLGTTVGAYRITGTIGQGGMGAVYAAEHTLLGREAAVKVLLPELSKNSEIVTRFFNEAKAATAIRHPGIVEIYDFGWNHDGAAYIVMEFLQGESLASRLARGRLAPAQALAIARQVAGALSAAHRKGIVHRDLKPDNAFLVPDPEVAGGERIKLLDFGIAKLVGDQSMSQKTRTGAVMGTPTYMAPEQCRGVAVDHRADLYSLGCIVFEMIAARPPFVGEGVGDVLAAHIHVPPPTLAPLANDVTPAIEQLVQRLLEKDPGRRHQTADELLHAIDATGAVSYQSAPRVSTAPHAVTAPTPTTLSGAAGSVTPTRTHAGRGPIFAGAGVVLAAVVGVVLVANRGDDKPASAGSQPEPELAANERRNIDHAKPEAVKSEPPMVEAPPTPQPPATPSPPAQPATVALSITTVPAGAEVVLNGVSLGTTPLDRTLPARDATETLTFRLTGYRDAQRKIRADSDIRLSVKLDKKRLVGGTTTTTDRDKSVNPFGN
jgi:eukaryotic-like serine/threonine-protein kinase